jgi:membrane associated rhomboid family serine protease
MSIGHMASRDRSVVLLGQSFPAVSVALAAALLAVSILAVNAPPLFHALLLVPGRASVGELWRLVSWPFLARDPLSLVFASLALLWLGRDLAYAWGPRRFLRVWFGLSAATGVAICALALLWPPLRSIPFEAPFAMVSALVVAWAVLFPGRQILMMFVLPLQGQQLIWATLGLLLVYGLMQGLLDVLPHLVATGLILYHLRYGGPETLWLRLRYRWLELRAGRRRSHLRVVERDRREPPRWVH